MPRGDTLYYKNFNDNTARTEISLYHEEVTVFSMIYRITRYILVFMLIASAVIFKPGVSPEKAAAEAPGSVLSGIAWEGMPTPAGGVFQYSGYGYNRTFACVETNEQGDISFIGQVFDGLDYFSAIFHYSAKTGMLAKVVAEGDTNPYGTAFDSIWAPHLNSYPVIMFYADYRTQPTGEEPDGHSARGLFYSYNGNIFPILTSEMKKYTLATAEGVLDGYFIDMINADINRYNQVVVDGTVGFFRPSDLPGGSPKEYMRGVYRMNISGTGITEIFIEGDPAPGGGTIGSNIVDDEYRSVRISDGGYIARSCRIDGIPQPYAGTILLRSPDGTISRAVTKGDVLPVDGLPGETPVTVDSISFIGLNSCGQVAAGIIDTGWKRHLYIFTPGEQPHKVITRGQFSPRQWEPAWGPAPFFETEWWPVSGAMNDNQVPLDGLISGYSAEMVFTTRAGNGWGMFFNDIYSYTSDKEIRTVVLEDDPAPEPPGGVVIPGGQKKSYGDARMVMNNTGQIVINGFIEVSGIPVNAVMKTSLDSDGDGLLDSWETIGIDINSDGIIDLDLPALGARPDHKDLFLEVDYMGDDTHSHLPPDTVFTDVIGAFANAPVENPDGTTGTKLHILKDERLAHIAVIKAFEDYDTIKNISFGTAAERSSPDSVNILGAKRFVYRYCLIAHQYSMFNSTAGTWQTTTSSGRAEIAGNDFLVTLGAFDGGTGNADQQSGTFMHEYGHTLGLRHGGFDDINAKPNYLSIMSYSRQFSSFVPGRPLDFSQSALPSLNEISLDEAEGIGGEAGDVTVFFTDTDNNTYNDSAVVVAGNVPVDWNQDGDTDDVGISVDINSLLWRLNAGVPEWRFPDAGCQLLRGYDDWENICYSVRQGGNFRDGEHPSVAEPDITWELFTSLTEVLNPPLPGDADMNGNIDILDITKVARIILEIDGATLGADANRDDIINIFDITKIARIILELE